MSGSGPFALGAGLGFIRGTASFWDVYHACIIDSCFGRESNPCEAIAEAAALDFMWKCVFLLSAVLC